MSDSAMGQSASDIKMEDQEDEQVTTESVPPVPVEGENSKSNSQALEWNFIDFTKAERCPIFDVDPVMLKKFVGHNVTVYNKSREVFHGCCLTIDPVSLSVILAVRVPDNKIRITTLPGYHLSKIYVDSECVDPESRVTVNDIDVAELYHAPDLLSNGSSKVNCPETDLTNHVHGADNQSADKTDTITESQNSVPQSLSPEEVTQRREKLEQLLNKFKMPFKQVDSVFELPGGIRINAPYNLESCDTKKNKITQKKIANLMKLM